MPNLCPKCINIKKCDKCGEEYQEPMFNIAGGGLWPNTIPSPRFAPDHFLLNFSNSRSE